jgi:hypothetical protein
MKKHGEMEVQPDTKLTSMEVNDECHSPVALSLGNIWIPFGQKAGGPESRLEVLTVSGPLVLISTFHCYKSMTDRLG